MNQLRRDERGLVRAARLSLPDETSQLLLVIDQFEEVFTLAADAAERDRLLELLAVAVEEPRSQVRVLISLRADFYDRPLVHPQFGHLMQARTEVLVPMNAEEMSDAIHRPAESAGVMIEPELITAMVSEVGGQPGALPLLQYALTELFERRDGRRLTLEAYHDMGGVLGALGRRAEEIYQGLEEAEQHAARQLFLRLVTLGEGVEDTRRRVLRSELEALQTPTRRLVEKSSDAVVITRVMDTFGKYRLLTFDRDPTTRSPTVEVAHEALLRKWDRLRAWLEGARDDIRQERAISRAAEEWDRHERDESFLLRGARLGQVEKWKRTSTLVQAPLVSAFIRQSLEARAERRRAEMERQAREARLERTRRTLTRGLIAVLSIGLVVALGLTYFAFTQRNEAEQSAALALAEADARATAERDALAQADARATAQGQVEAQRIAAEESAVDARNLALVSGSQAALANHDIDTAIALAWQAVALNPDSGKAQAQLSEAAYAPGPTRILRGNEDIMSWIEISPDDQHVLAGGDDGSVILWDIESGQMLWKQQPTREWVQDVAFSPDGRIAAATYDDRIMLWSAADGQLVREIASPVYRQNIAFSPNGGEFATIGSVKDSRLVIWDLATGEPIRDLDRGTEIEDLFYTPDGSAILIASKDGVLTLVDAQTMEVVWQIEADLGSGAGALRHVAASPDGTSVAAAFSNSGLMIWDFEAGDLLVHFRFPDGVFSLAFHPYDGSVLVGGQGAIRTVNPQTGGVSHEDTSTKSAIIDLAITSSGEYAVTTALDQSVRVLDLRQGQLVRRFSEPSALLYETDLSPDNRKALAGWTDGTVALWDVETGEEIWRYVGDQPILAVTFSPDGGKVLVGGGYRLAQKVESGHIILLDAETGAEIRRLEGQPYAVFDVEFSPDGRTAASAGNGAIAILWDVDTGEEIRRFLHEDYWVDSQWAHESYWDVAFTADGRQIYTAHSSGPIVVWDVDSGEAVGQLVGHAGGAIGMQFSNDGRVLVSGGTDSQVIVWNVESGEILGRWSDHSGGVGEVAFSPDENLLLGGGGDGTSSLWSLDKGEAIRRYGGFVFSSQFLQDGRYAVVGHRDGAVELWRIDRTLEELLTWVEANRYVPDLTCAQRELYRVEPLCEVGS
jgi:WD40 repeat protein